MHRHFVHLHLHLSPCGYNKTSRTLYIMLYLQTFRVTPYNVNAVTGEAMDGG